MSDPNLDPGHVFDQTNGVIEDLDGDSDGTATSDTTSAAERGEPDDTSDTLSGTASGAEQPGNSDDAAAAAGTTGATGAVGGDGSTDGAAPARSGTGDDAREPSSTTVEPSHDGDGAGPDFAPTSDLPLPGDHDAADQGQEHVYAVAEDGTATDEGEAAAPASAGADEGGTTATYSDAPAVATRSAADDGRDEMSDGTSTGERAGRGRSEGDDTVAAYDSGPAQEVDAGSDTGGRETPAGVADLSGGDIGHVFDQTNGVIEGLEGESDGTAEGDEESRADRVGENEPNPVGQQDAFRDDHYGEDAGADRNA